jgi:hypothetical protein
LEARPGLEGARGVRLATGEAVGVGTLVLGAAGHGIDAGVLGATGRGVGVGMAGHGLGAAGTVGAGGRRLGVLRPGLGASVPASGKSSGVPLQNLFLH